MDRKGLFRIREGESEKLIMVLGFRNRVHRSHCLSGHVELSPHFGFDCLILFYFATLPGSSYQKYSRTVVSILAAH